MELTTDQGWYAYLRLGPEATTDEIDHAVERLSRQASALAVTAPERSQLLRETIRTIKRDLLSGPESRLRYDALHAQRPRPSAPGGAPAPMPPPAAPPAPAAPPGPAGPAALTGRAAPAAPAAARPGLAGAGGGRLARFLRTGWTCPSCGKGAVPSEKFCTKCGTPIRPTQPDAASRPPRARSACQACANPIGPTDVFCSRCGARH